MDRKNVFFSLGTFSDICTLNNEANKNSLIIGFWETSMAKTISDFNTEKRKKAGNSVNKQKCV